MSIVLIVFVVSMITSSNIKIFNKILLSSLFSLLVFLFEYRGAESKNYWILLLYLFCGWMLIFVDFIIDKHGDKKFYLFSKTKKKKKTGKNDKGKPS